MYVNKDIVFDPDLFVPLAKSLDFIWQRQINGNRLQLLIASTIRNEETYEKFIKTLGIY